MKAIKEISPEYVEHTPDILPIDAKTHQDSFLY